MTRIAPVNSAFNPKVLWFDALDFELAVGMPVVVTTARGLEFGYIAEEVFDATDEQIAQLKSPLQPVVRIATPEDEEQARKMEALSREAFPVFKELAAESRDLMRPVSVEFLFEGDKAIFYFESEDRVDFRELVRKLAAKFHVRIDMRQIGVRDGARIIGGIGHCGQELCCKRMGGEFCPVSIRMAKEQDLSLNPQKISGLCGRLMCCLRYEYEAYKDFKGRAPKLNATIDTPAGEGHVVDFDVPREVISVKVGEEKALKVPLSDFEPAPDGGRPRSIGDAAWTYAQESATWGKVMPAFSASVMETSKLTAEDTLAEPGSVKVTGRSDKGNKGQGVRGRKDKNAAKSQEGSAASSNKSRRKDSQGSSAAVSKRNPRRSTKLSSKDLQETAHTLEETTKPSAQKEPRNRGQHLRKRVSVGTKRPDESSKSGISMAQDGSNASQRKHKSQKGTSSDTSRNLRPGHKSSGLRSESAQKAGNASRGGNQAKTSAQQNAPRQQKPTQSAHGDTTPGRKSRRRSHKSTPKQNGTPDAK